MFRGVSCCFSLTAPLQGMVGPGISFLSPAFTLAAVRASSSSWGSFLPIFLPLQTRAEKPCLAPLPSATRKTRPEAAQRLRAARAELWCPWSCSRRVRTPSTQHPEGLCSGVGAAGNPVVLEHPQKGNGPLGVTCSPPQPFPRLQGRGSPSRPPPGWVKQGGAEQRPEAMCPKAESGPPLSVSAPKRAKKKKKKKPNKTTTTKNPNCFNHADGKGAEAEHFVAVISSI